ncbi:MAG: hypothetical protein Q4P31_01620 [Andreesenia angusta]|nr:hypothetical protein [Andreesenia angusta]
MNEKIELIIPAKAENISVARLTASSIGMKMKLSIDEIEDIKLCVGEACNILLQKSNIDKDDSIYIEFLISEDIDISVSTKKSKSKKSIEFVNDKELTYARMILQTLMDCVEVDLNDDIKIIMKKDMEKIDE